MKLGNEGLDSRLGEARGNTPSQPKSQGKKTPGGPGSLWHRDSLMESGACVDAAAFEL